MLSSKGYDYIVVGAGTAGCVVAARLTERPGTRVLLLEAGPPDTLAEIAIPPAWPGLWGTEVDYGYLTIPQREMNQAVVSWPRGRTLGGSSSINGMVYLRGHRNDYDSWVEAGAAGWSFDDVLPYLRKMESVPGGDTVWRGQHGPLHPAVAADPNPLSPVFLEAAAAAGFPMSKDMNGADPEGAGWHDLAIVEGRRQSIADAYLHPVAERRTNLTIASGSRAVDLLWAAGRCIGVRFARGTEIVEARADAEVILCAGAVDSPRLLLLSGVGPADELIAAGVDVVHDLPGVGRNLHDHPLVSVVYEACKAIPPTANNHAEVSMLWRSDAALPGPDMQLLFAHTPFHLPTLESAPNSFTFCVATVPDSRGSVRLRDADPASAPLIDPNYFSEARDLERLIDGISVPRELAHTAPFADWRKEEALPGSDLITRHEVAEFVRRATGSYFHPVGSCAMGVGPDAVVTPELRVRGVEGLRVVDAPVMPRVVSVNTNVAVTAIAERAAELIAGEVRTEPRQISSTHR